MFHYGTLEHMKRLKHALFFPKHLIRMTQTHKI